MYNLFIVLCIVCIIVLIFYFKQNENFVGALDSLYSNDGIQDKYLTGNHYDKFLDDGFSAFWMPTRSLNRVVFYPHHFDMNIEDIFY